MEDEQFRNVVSSYLNSASPNTLTTELPAGSGIFHIANVPPEQFSPAWMSTSSGRFSVGGDKVRYFANNFDVCAHELGFGPGVEPSGVVFVASELSKSFSVIDVNKLPENIRNELYADKNQATKWQKSHVFMEAIRHNKGFGELRGVYFPSASGIVLGTGGFCLALFEVPLPQSIVGSGDHAWWIAQRESS